MDFVFIINLTTVCAQPIAGHMDFSVSVGKTSGTEIFSDFMSVGERSRYLLQSADRPVFVSGKYYLLDRTAIGGTIGIQTLYGTNGDYNSSLPFKYRQTTVTFAFEATPVYVVIKYLQVYAIFGVGFFGAHAVYKSTPSGQQASEFNGTLPEAGLTRR